MCACVKATLTVILQGIQTTFGIALSSAHTQPHCELHGHKQRIESSPLRQSSSGSGLGSQSSLHKLLMRGLMDMLHEGKGEGEREGEGKGKGRGRRMGRRLLKLPTLQTQLHKHMSSEMTPFLSASLR